MDSSFFICILVVSPIYMYTHINIIETEAWFFFSLSALLGLLESDPYGKGSKLAVFQFEVITEKWVEKQNEGPNFS